MKPLLKTKDVCELLGVSSRTVRRLTQSGQLRCISLSRNFVRFREEDVEQFVQEWSTQRRL